MGYLFWSLLKVFVMKVDFCSMSNWSWFSILQYGTCETKGYWTEGVGDNKDGVWLPGRSFDQLEVKDTQNAWPGFHDILS